MTDKLSKEKRSNLMRSIKSKDSQIELKLRKKLWANGLRYRKNYKKLPGKPDIVFISAKLAVFCDSEFWHGKNWEKRKLEHKTNKEFWINKIEKNMERDVEVNEQLQALGWTVLRFWGNDILKNTDECVSKIMLKLQ